MFDSFVADVKATTSSAPVDNQLRAFTYLTGRSVPKLQGHTVPVSGSTVVEECLAASGISAGENQARFRHMNQSFIFTSTDIHRET